MPRQFPAGTSEPIGRVETSAGQVNATRADGSQVTLTQGDPIFAGDILETGSDGTIGIVFADESTFSLGEDGRMTLDEMIYDPGTQEGSMQVNLLQGAFTFVSGQIAKTDVDAMIITTPTSTIGIRGTAGGGQVSTLGGTTATLLPEANSLGEMTLGNAFGTQTINQALQAVNVASANAAPSGSFFMTAQQVGQTFGSAMSALPNAATALDSATVQGANEGRQQQQAAEQAADEAAANQAAAEANSQGADQAEQAAQDAVDAAQDAADLAADAASDPNATDEEKAAALAAAENLAEAQQLVETAQADLAVANAELAAAAADAAQAAVGVLETSAGGAIASAALNSGITNIPGGDELNAARNEVIALLAEADALQAAADEILSGIDDILGPGPDGPGPDGPETGELGPEGPDPFGPDPFGPDPFGPDPFGPDPFGLDPFGFDPTFDPFFQAFLDPFEELFFGPPEDFFFFEDDEFFFQDDVIGEFSETLAASVNNDFLIGGDENTQFTMTQGSTLGGTDTVDGGFGTDELNFSNLTDFEGVYNAATQTMSYQFSGGSGNITLFDIEQLYADNGLEAKVRLNIESAVSGHSFIRSGSSNNDDIDLSGGADLHLLNTYQSSGKVPANIIGTIIFGNAGDDTITGSSGQDQIYGGVGLDVINGGQSSDTLYGGDGDDQLLGNSGSDHLFGGAGADTLTGGFGSDILDGGADNDTFNVDDTDTIDGGTGTDTINITNIAGASVSAVGVETINGGAGSDSVDLSGQAASGETVSLGNGVADTVTLGNFNNSLTVSGVETVIGGTGTDSVTLSGSGAISLTDVEMITGGTGGTYITTTTGLSAGTTIDGGSGFDTISLSSAGNTATFSNFGEINGGSGADILTTSGTGGGGIRINTGAGADSISIGANGSHGIIIDSISGFGDTITGFRSGKDYIDFNLELSTAGTSIGGFQNASGSATITSTSGVINYETTIANFSTESDVATALNNLDLTALGTSGANILFAVGDTTDTELWYWQDANTDGVIDSGELLSVAKLTSFNNTTLVAADLPTFVAIDTGGFTQTIAMNGGSIADIITGDSSDDVSTLDKTAKLGDTYDGGLGADTLNLAASRNDITVSNTETINGNTGIDWVTLGTALTSGVVNLGDATDRLTLANGTNSVTTTSIETIVGGSGTDSITLADGGQTVENMSGVETVTGGSGNDVVYFTDSTIVNIDMAGGTDTVYLGNSTNAITAVNTETIVGGSGVDTVTLTNVANTMTIYGVETLTGAATADDIITVGAPTTNLTIDLQGGTGNILNLAGGTNTISLASSLATLTGGSGTDTINLSGSGSYTLDSVSGIEAIDGQSASSVALTLASGIHFMALTNINSVDGTTGPLNLTLTNSQSGLTLTGTSGTADILTLNDTGNTVTVLDFETVYGGDDTDDITYNSQALSGTTIYGGGGFDTLTLFNAGNDTVSISDVETVISLGGNDVITYTSLALNGTTIDGGAGTDSLTFSNSGNNEFEVSNVESVTTGAGDDSIILSGSTAATITAGGGADYIENFSSANITIRYTNITDSAAGIFTRDEIFGFDAGGGASANDKIDILGIGLSGTFTYSALSANGNASAFLNGTVLEIDNDGDAVADMEIEMTSLTGTLDTSDFIHTV